MDDKKKKRDIVNQLKKQAENAKASKETGFINENTGSSICNWTCHRNFS